MDGTRGRGTARCGSVQEDLGAYVLGALEPEENERTIAHLAVCSACRAEHDELAEVVALLATPSSLTTRRGPESGPFAVGQGDDA